MSSSSGQATPSTHPLHRFVEEFRQLATARMALVDFYLAFSNRDWRSLGGAESMKALEEVKQSIEETRGDVEVEGEKASKFATVTRRLYEREFDVWEGL